MTFKRTLQDRGVCEGHIKNNNSQYVAEYDGSIIGWADIVPLRHETMKHVGSLGIGVMSWA